MDFIEGFGWMTRSAFPADMPFVIIDFGAFQECQRDLASVLPILQGAIESLNSIDKADIAEIRYVLIQVLHFRSDQWNTLTKLHMA